MVEIGVINKIIILIDLLVRDKMSISNQLTTHNFFSKESNHVPVLIAIMSFIINKYLLGKCENSYTT